MSEYVGLNEEEVKNNQKLYGLNISNNKTNNSFIKSLLSLIKEPIFILIVILLGIYVFQKEYIYLVILIILLILVVSIHFIYTFKLNKLFKKIHRTQSYKTKVIRNSKIETIDSEEVTINDILVLNKGDKVVADSIILESSNLYVYENKLSTGNKITNLDSIYQKFENNFLYNGSYVTNGNCLARVTSIGSKTKFYENNNKDYFSSTLQEKTKKIGLLFSIISVFLFIIITVILCFKMKLTTSMLYGFNIMLNMIPYPLIFMSAILYPYNILKLINNDILIKNLNIINKINRITCLCVDKTKIITEGKMKVTNIKTDIEKEELIRHALLASSLTPIDIIEKSISDYSNYLGIEINDKRELIKKYPFDKNTKMSANIYKENDEYYIYVKGSLESLFDICNSNIGVEEKFSLFNYKDDMINSGLKAVAVGSARINKIENDLLDYNINFDGLIGIYDEPRLNVRKDIEYCQNNGIKVLMFTDDNKEISSFIGKTIGLNNYDMILNSEEVSDKEKFLDSINNTNIFSQVTVEDKLKIIKYLQKNNEIIASTSYSVEDIYSSINSSIVISFSDSPDINRNTSDIICLNNNFSTIVNNIKRVKKIYKYFKKMRKFILLIDIPIVMLSIILSFLKFNILLLPLFIIALRIVILIICCVKFNKQ